MASNSYLSSLLKSSINHQSNRYVVVFMGSLLCVDGKSSFSSVSGARRFATQCISRDYHSCATLQSMYDTSGKLRTHLESVQLLQIVPADSISLDIEVHESDVIKVK